MMGKFYWSISAVTFRVFSYQFLHRKNGNQEFEQFSYTEEPIQIEWRPTHQIGIKSTTMTVFYVK